MASLVIRTICIFCILSAVMNNAFSQQLNTVHMVSPLFIAKKTQTFVFMSLGKAQSSKLFICSHKITTDTKYIFNQLFY